MAASSLERNGSLKRTHSVGSKADLLARFTDVRLVKYGGEAVTQGVDRRYSMSLMQQVDGTISLDLSRPSVQMVPGAVDSTSKVKVGPLVAGEITSIGPRVVAFGKDEAAAIELMSQSETRGFMGAVDEYGLGKNLSLNLNLDDVSTQRYVCELLLDPKFEDFVQDMGDFVARLRAGSRAPGVTAPAGESSSGLICSQPRDAVADDASIL